MGKVKRLPLLWFSIALLSGALAGAAVRANPRTAVQSPGERVSSPPVLGTEATVPPAAIPLATACAGNDLCSTDQRCCTERCKCNGFQLGLCQKRESSTVACWCTNNRTIWQTAPKTCKE